MDIREEKMNDEFTKFHLDGFPFSAVLHKFDGRGIDPQIHDHPWAFTSFIIKGSYVERRYYVKSDGSFTSREILHKTGESFRVRATDIHEIIAYPEGECWTLILPEPWERESLVWSFDGRARYKSWRPNSEWTLHKVG